MSEHGPDRPTPRGVAEAVIETRSRPSIIWVIPVVAALAVWWLTSPSRAPWRSRRSIPTLRRPGRVPAAVSVGSDG